MSMTTATSIFMMDCIDMAGGENADRPEVSACLEAADEMSHQASYDSYKKFMDTSSKLADYLIGFQVITSGSDLQRFADTVWEYNSSAKAISENYLGNREEEAPPISWIQKQDDGIFTNGKSGTSGGAGASGDWGLPAPPKYPEGVPVVPPQIIPGEKERITKIQPQPPTQPKGCVNKREPTIGEISHITPVMMPGPARFDVYWFDNIVERSQQKQYDHEAVERTQYKGSPCGMPAFAEIAMFADLPKGRYKVETVEHNIVGYMSTNPRFYDAVEGWYWKGDRIYTPVTIRSHGDDYHECLAIEFQDFSGMYLYQYSYGWDEEGKGHAVHYTYGRARIVFLGAEFPPVVETPSLICSPVLSAGMAVNQHIFRTLSFLGGLWGRYEPI